MAVSKQFILSKLPAFQNKRVTVLDKQEVTDIISTILEAHRENEWLYDKIGRYFIGADIDETCQNLYNFCLENLRYDEESDKLQTVQVPQGLLSVGHCDCKGYASFICGCIAAIARTTGGKINWHYCFASYKFLQKTPYHVFAVIDEAKGPIWVDPTPGSDGRDPVWWVNKTVKSSGMLQKVIGRVRDERMGSADYLQPVPPLAAAQYDLAASVLLNSQTAAADGNTVPQITENLTPATTDATVSTTDNIADIAPKQKITGTQVVAGLAGIAAVYFLLHPGKTIGAKQKGSGKGRKKKSILPFVLIGGAGLYYLYTKNQAAAVTPPPVDNTPPPVDNTPPPDPNKIITYITKPAPTTADDTSIYNQLFNYSVPWRYAVDRMSVTERRTLYDYIWGYVKAGLHLYNYAGIYQDGFYDPTFYNAVLALSNKWNLGLLY